MTDRPNISSIDENMNANRLKNLHRFQVMILLSALLKFPNVKRIVYSTCSLNREENEDVIDEVMKDVGGAYRLVPIKKIFGNDWINYSSMDSGCKDNCLYAKPEVDYTNGFFVAMFERNFDVPLPREWCHYESTENTESKKVNCAVETKQSSVHCQQIENEQEKGKKKKKKRRKKKRAAEETEAQEPPPKKKASNPVEEKNTELNTTETVSTNKTDEVIDNGETENLSKIKSKRKKNKTSFNDNTTETYNETINDSQEMPDVDSTVEKKHKKKKKKSK